VCVCVCVCVCVRGKMGCYSTQTHRTFDEILRSTTEVKNKKEAYTFGGLFSVRCLTTQLTFRTNKTNLSNKNEVLQSNKEL
jgi:hypothetical protein